MQHRKGTSAVAFLAILLPRSNSKLVYDLPAGAARLQLVGPLGGGVRKGAAQSWCIGVSQQLDGPTLVPLWSCFHWPCAASATARQQLDGPTLVPLWFRFRWPCAPGAARLRLDGPTLVPLWSRFRWPGTARVRARQQPDGPTLVLLLLALRRQCNSQTAAGWSNIDPALVPLPLALRRPHRPVGIPA